MTRAVLAMMAGLLCTLAGFRHAAALKGDALRLVRWVQVLRHLVLLLEEGTTSIPEALCAAADTADTPDKLLRGIAAKMQTTPLLTPIKAFRLISTPCTENDILQRMFHRIGQGSRENRCLAVRQAAEELSLLAEQAANRADKDVRLWQTLGFIGGLCLTIMLL